jgi:hypothetical protein
MKIHVVRTFIPIEKDVEDCHDCPYYREDNDGHMTLQMCEHPSFGTGGYDNVIPDLNRRWEKNYQKKISKRCPYRRL